MSKSTHSTELEHASVVIDRLEANLKARLDALLHAKTGVAVQGSAAVQAAIDMCVCLSASSSFSVLLPTSPFALS